MVDGKDISSVLQYIGNDIQQVISKRLLAIFQYIFSRSFTQASPSRIASQILVVEMIEHRGDAAT